MIKKFYEVGPKDYNFTQTGDFNLPRQTDPYQLMMIPGDSALLVVSLAFNVSV